MIYKLSNKISCELIKLILIKNCKYQYNKIIYNKLYNKATKIYFYTKEKNINCDDIFRLAINYINKIADKKIQIFFIFGLQSLFNNFSKNNIPRLYFVITFLHKFYNEKNIYDIDWHETMFKILSLSFSKIKNLNQYYNCLEQSYKNNKINCHSFYIAMNSESVKLELQNYEDLRNDDLSLNYINYLIDLTNKTKSKLFGIEI